MYNLIYISLKNVKTTKMSHIFLRPILPIKKT